jgi:bifunctional UDP-N-acetylglucosamine pyrophosphorylase/glucosamine-1-phosphate N-acetyltransferase
MPDVEAIVLAAGKGKRMMSALPKVLHRICGRPMIAYVLDRLADLSIASPIVVVGHEAEQVKAAVGGVRTVVQAEQGGTGHAVMQAMPLLAGFSGTVLVLYGDVPLLRSETIDVLQTHHREQTAAATILTDVPTDPTGYGRIIRDAHGNVRRIVEDADASPDERQIREVNAGIYAFDAGALRDSLRAVGPANAQAVLPDRRDRRVAAQRAHRRRGRGRVHRRVQGD